jgi:hypothetical protein
MNNTNALSPFFLSLLVASFTLSVTGCDEDGTNESGSVDASANTGRDVIGSDTSQQDTSAAADAGSDAESTPETSGGYSARYQELIDANFAQCVEFCVAWEACGEAVLGAGETCDDFCEVDADILRANIPDQADGYDCMQAGIDAYGCNADLTCDEVTEYNTDQATTLCSIEDTNFGTFCRDFF